MRAWDNWNSYLDNDGNLLHGKVRFCNRGTTEDIVIYNSDGIAVRNPEFTDMLGRTEYQVFVENVDNVTAYFYKYIGTGDMMSWPGEDYDPTRWALQYTSDNMDPVSKIDIESNTASGASDMAAFRAVDPAEVPAVNGRKLMWLYGYYAAGDTSPVLYVWDSASQQVDDGGSCIQANDVPGAGRWKLCTRELHFDVRHFGVFPTDDINSTDYQYTSQLANCAAYLDKEGLDAWFPALNDNLSYYLYNGTNTFAIKGDIYVSDAVRMHAKTGTTGTRITARAIHKSTPYLFVSSVQDGSVVLEADLINISWVGSGRVTGAARVGWVIDCNDFPRSITGKQVKFLTNGNGSLQLDDCLVESNGAITGHITIQNCLLDTGWFADDYDWANLTSIGNDIRLGNCTDADTYITLKNKQGENSYGDLDGLAITGTSLLPGARVSNATFSNVTLQGNSTLYNVSGTVTISGTPSCEWTNCNLTVSGSPTTGQLSLKDSTIGGSGKVTVVSTAFSAISSNINIPVDVKGVNLTLRDSVINAAIDHLQASPNETVIGCVFNAQLTVHGGSSTATLSAVWVGNHGTVSNPLNLDRSTLNPSNLTHTYKYANNTGTFPSATSYKYQLNLTCSTTVGDNNFITGVPKGEPMPWMLIAYTAGETVTHFPNITLFRVGTDDISLTVRWRMVNFRLNNYSYGIWEITPVDFPMICKFQSGYTWKPQVIEHTPVTSGDNYYPTYMGIGHFAREGSWVGATLLGAFEFCVA